MLLREDYELLDNMNAIRVAPILDDLFVDPQSWEALSLATKSAPVEV